MNMLLGRQAVTKEYFAVQNSGTLTSATAGSCDDLVPILKNSLSGSEPIGQIEHRWKSTIVAQESALRKVGMDTTGLFPEAALAKTLGAIFGAALDIIESDELDEIRRMRPTGRYASQIVKYLLLRNVVSDSMWPGGVVAAALLPCGDWVSRSWCVNPPADNY